MRTIGVSHGRTLEETARLQNEHPREREEYQALQDANLLTVQRLKAMVAQVRQCLIDGFPETEQISDQFETLLTRYHKMQVQPDIFVLKVRGFMHRASQLFLTEDVNLAVSATKAEAEPSPGPMELVEKDRPRRTPDIETRRRRIALCNELSRELAAVHREVKKHTTVQRLKTKYPSFKLWEILSEPEQQELIDDEFKPRAYPNRLALRIYGLTSLSTLKKDRKKLRDAQERPAAP